jgi:hypothetical protein
MNTENTNKKTDRTLKSGNTVFYEVTVLLTKEQLEHVLKMGFGSANVYIRELIDDDIEVANRLFETWENHKHSTTEAERKS